MTAEARSSELRFFLDRGLGSRIVPQSLRQAGWALETMDERYGKERSQKIPDTEWIQDAALAGDVLLCKDLAVARNPLEAQIVYMTGARVFALASARLTGPAMAELYTDSEASIVRAALRASGPYVMAVSAASGLRRVRLAYPSS